MPRLAVFFNRTLCVLFFILNFYMCFCISLFDFCYIMRYDTKTTFIDSIGWQDSRLRPRLAGFFQYDSRAHDRQTLLGFISL